MIENHQHDPLYEGEILHCADNPGSSLKKHLNPLLGSGCSGNCRRRTHVHVKSPAKWKGEKDPQDTRADQSFSRMSSQVVKYRLIRRFIEADHRLSDPTALARKLTVLGEAHRTVVPQKAGPSHCCLVFFSRILTQAANYCQDLHERMFLEQLLLPN